MTHGVMQLVRGAPWFMAAALYAWLVAAALVVFLNPSTIVVVGPPAIVATMPILAPHPHQSRVAIVAATVLAVWAIVGITLLGSYFLPSAILLGLGYVRRRVYSR